MKSLNAAMRVLLVGAALGGLAHAGVVFLDRGLPNSTSVNGASATRSNEAWVTGFPTDPTNTVFNLVGDNLSFANSGIIDSLTVFEVANNIVGGASSSLPTAEFSSISLYLGTDTLATTTGIPLVSSSYYANPVGYQPGNVNFVGTGGTFPIYAVTFGGLNFAVTAGTVYDFALNAVGNPGACANPLSAPFGEPCLLALHGSNAALAGTPQDGADGQFINFTLPAGGTATVLGACNAACQASTLGVASVAATDIDVIVNPEPATLWGTLGAGLIGLMLYARKRRSA